MGASSGFVRITEIQKFILNHVVVMGYHWYQWSKPQKCDLGNNIFPALRAVKEV